MEKGKKTRGTTTKRIVGSRLSTIIRGIGVEINHNAGKFEPIIRNRNWPARWPPMEMDYWSDYSEDAVSCSIRWPNRIYRVIHGSCFDRRDSGKRKFDNPFDSVCDVFFSKKVFNKNFPLRGYRYTYF